jgi:hypothetical protein
MGDKINFLKLYTPIRYTKPTRLFIKTKLKDTLEMNSKIRPSILFLQMNFYNDSSNVTGNMAVNWFTQVEEERRNISSLFHSKR